MKRKLLLFGALFFIFLNGIAQVNSVALVGEAAGGWPGDAGNPGPTDVHQMTSSDGKNWTLSGITLTSAVSGGGVKFRANNAWDLNWGAAAFPSGTATLGGSNISCLAGTYDVAFNSTTGVYSFSGTPIVFPSIAIVGPGAGGWPNDPQTDANQLSTTDGTTYKINSVPLTIGAIKFRQNNSWTVSWGGGSFPAGPTNASLDIAVTAPGKYRTVFNRTSGAYNFDFPPISIVGEAVGGWPGDAGNPGPTDVHQLVTTDGETYTINNLVVTTATSGGGAKFRQDNQWQTSWGSAAFPSAPSSDGTNIATVAGTYNVTFTRSTGAYTFVSTLNNSNFSHTTLKVYPNPTQSSWNILSNQETIKSIEIVDMLGKVMMFKSYDTLNATIDITNATSGIYFARVTTENSSQILKLIKQ